MYYTKELDSPSAATNPIDPTNGSVVNERMTEMKRTMHSATKNVVPHKHIGSNKLKKETVTAPM